MIKAKKSLLITLFAAMMIFALGATSAFAADVDGTWNKDYSEVTVDGVTYTTTTAIKVVREWQSDGVVKAYLDDSAVAPGARPANTAKPIYFYDFTGAQLAVDGAAVYGTYDKAAFKKLFSGATGEKIDGLVLTVPSYVKDASTITPKTLGLKASDLKSWTVKATQPSDYDDKALVDKTYTVAGEIESINADGTAAHPFRVDENAITKDIIVKATTQTSADVMFFLDEVSTEAGDEIATAAVEGEVIVPASATTFKYNGAAHKIVSNEIAGFPVSWTVLNTKTGKYEDVSECPTVTNVGDTAKVKATVTWTTTTTSGGSTITTTHAATNTFTLSVEANTDKPYFEFDKDGTVGNWAYGVDGAEYDAYSYIKAKTADAAAKTLKDAVEVDQATLLEYFKDFYEIKAESSKAYPDAVTLTIAEKTNLTTDEKTALAKKYEALLANYGVTKIIANTTQKATVNLNGSGLLVPEIEFIDSPTAVTYKAKKLKKKEASFTVTAVSSNGVPVTYKLINAPAKIKIDKTSGMITLGKGLKKGKYNITVKAFIAQGFEDRNGVVVYPSETHAIKIKVKK